MLLLLLPFSFFLFLDFRVRYEFSDMAKRERGGKESLSPPHRTASRLSYLLTRYRSLPPSLGRGAASTGVYQELQDGPVLHKGPRKKNFFSRGGRERRMEGGGLTPINAALYNTRKRSPPTRRRNIKITFADTRISKKDETPP